MMVAKNLAMSVIHHDLVLMLSAHESSWLSDWFSRVSIAAFVLALFSIPSVLMQRRGRPQSALTWVLVLFSVPIIGLVLWWAVGRRHLVRKRRRRRLATGQRSERLTDLRDELPIQPEADWDFLSVRRLPPEEAEWVFVPTHGNTVELLVDAAQAYPAMQQAIQSADQYIHVLYYIWEADPTGRLFRDLLVERARRGLEVRVLYDAIGGSAVRGKFMRPLIEAGAQVAAFMPPKLFRRSLELNFRNHRKIIVADGREAIVGGLNIGDEYQSNWRDAAVRLTGPVVDQLQEIFADDWHFTTHEDFASPNYFGAWCETIPPPQAHPAICGVVASGPHTHINLTHEAFFTAITRASERIWITTPYYIPDPVIMAALRTAVFRGVDVRMIVPQRGDSWFVTWAGRSFYPELLRAGVRLFEYGPGFLHAKTVLIDQNLSIIGSANMDIRSFRLNFEVSCLIQSTEFASDVAKLFESYLKESRELSLAEVESRPYLTRLGEAVVHLLSPIL
ncbi:MAG: cardiolipin synthase [Pirellulales bacterium]|nr:cardiolipin synthase [Pirellulales bacterium]